MNKINKTLAIAAIAVASTFAAQSAKAQDTFGTDFGTPISVEVQPEADADFSISSFDDETYMDNGSADRGCLETIQKLKPVILDLLKNHPDLTAQAIIEKAKTICSGVVFSGIVISGLYMFINGVRKVFTYGQ